jgi:hypothetical protein
MEIIIFIKEDNNTQDMYINNFINNFSKYRFGKKDNIQLKIR